MSEPIGLRAGPVVLRAWDVADAAAVLAALADPGIALWNASAVPDLAAAREWVASRADWSDGDHVSLAVADRDGVLLGSVSLHRIDREQGDAEIGYWIVPAARGKGAATRAVALVTDWALRTLPINRIELVHAVENTASARVAERAGFILEGRLRRSYRYGDGVKHDELLWSRLATDPPH